MQLPIGYDDFGKIADKKLKFIDKSLFIKEVFDDESTEAIVITRPRRFGKTLNLSMLHYFLAAEVYGQPTAKLFQQLDKLKIVQCGQAYMRHQGQYPVISITFKDIKQSNFNDTLKKFNELIIRAYDQHNYLETSDKLTSAQKELYGIILHRKADRLQLEEALQTLTRCLSIHHGVKPWLLIDEYDTPIQEGYLNGYYNQIIEFMRGLFGSALKNNPYLNKAVITGILRIAKESLFSGVNNLKTYSILHDKYSEYFGFTETEVEEILKDANLTSKAGDIKAWYNGYQFGKTTIYNPWSIANCIHESGETEPYWINTSGNQLIKDRLKKAPLVFKAEFEKLMQGGMTEQLIDENMVFAELDTNSSAPWSLLLMSGYLTPMVCEKTWNGTVCQLRAPNQEVNNLYRQIIASWLANGYGFKWYDEFIDSLVTGKIEILKEHLEKIMLQIISFHDLAIEPEAFFHGLLLGCVASLQETHEIKSNRESGLGRFDIMLIPKDISKLGIVIEIKAKRADEKASLENLAKAALKQVNEKHYITELKQRGITRVKKIAIAFEGKLLALCAA
jgi:hypothetical protein